MEIRQELRNLNLWRESILRKDDLSFEKKKEFLEGIVRGRESLEKELHGLQHQESTLYNIGEKNPIIEGAVDWWSGAPHEQNKPVMGTGLPTPKITETNDRPKQKTKRKRRTKLELETLTPKVEEAYQDLYYQGKCSWDEIFEEMAKNSKKLFGEKISSGSLQGIYNRRKSSRR